MEIDNMNPSDFAVMVRNIFNFLEKQSFVYSWSGGYSVRYDSSTVFVMVGYDAKRSYELAINIGLQVGISHSVERSFTISEMLRIIGRPDLGKATNLIQALPDEARNKIEWLAGLLREHASGLLDGDRTLFEMMDKQREADCRVYALQTKLAEGTREAGKAWQLKKYDEVVKHLEPLAEYLPTSEQKRLEIARRRSQSK